MVWDQLTVNKVLLTSLTAWLLAQLLKMPIEYLLTRKINWGILISTGGMPSSHSALVTSTMLAIGLWHGFDTPVFALALAVAMVVLYDAAGIRRQAGLHAKRINTIINELLAGHPISENQLKEVLGHTPRQVIGGFLLGCTVALVFFYWWK